MRSVYRLSRCNRSMVPSSFLYPSYERDRSISTLRKLGLAADAALTAFRNPKRDDAVAVLGETTGSIALQRMRDRMYQSPTGRDILKRKPVIREETIDLAALREKARPGTLGRGYVDFMDSHGFSPNERKPVQYVEDPELAYVMRRYREVHDFWHVLVDVETSVRGEIALKWFELVQTGLPMNALSAVVGPFALDVPTAAKVWAVDFPWAIEAGHRAEFLMNVAYEDCLDEDVDILREELRILRHPGMR
eukprot:g3512.t1